jgi:hypothetical protein
VKTGYYNFRNDLIKNPAFQETGKFSSLPQQLRVQQLRKFIDGACTDQSIPSHDFKNLINTSDSYVNASTNTNVNSQHYSSNIDYSQIRI